MDLSKTTINLLSELIKLNRLNTDISVDINKLSKLNMDEVMLLSKMNELSQSGFFSEYKVFIDGSYHIILADKALIYKSNKRKNIFLSIIKLIIK
jgi:hypothetical protein